MSTGAKNELNIEDDGVEIHSDFLGRDSLTEIIAELKILESGIPTHGIRNAEKKLDTVYNLVNSDFLRDRAKKYTSGPPDVVRVIVFDKTPDKNWFVAWHQDKTIAVSHRIDIPGWGPWTVKEGVRHVQPEIKVLEDMVTFRIHLDDAGLHNGCLKVIPGSHNQGILDKEELDRVVRKSDKFICDVIAGDLLIMRPHLIHSSSKGTSPQHRRIIHVEYSSFKLPSGLTWA